MIQMKTTSEWRQIYADLKYKKIGFVPTMGYLHAGHLSLVQKAKEENDIVVVSIFVNQLQFGENEDFSTYPRNIEKDAQLAKEAGADYLFVPDHQEMYPQPIRTKVSVQQITEGMCGKSRPGHFDGVATVVSKLFHIIQPSQAYFGLKDAQQIAVITQMVEDLNFPVHIRSCPIIREDDGLAMSSRNVYLSEEERREATILYQSLQDAEQLILDGERNLDDLIQKITEKIQSSPLATVEYVEIREFPSLNEVSYLKKKAKVIIALAVKFGKTRLIDNKIMMLES